MIETLISLLPFIIGSTLVPVRIIIVTMLLTSEKQRVQKAIAYVSGLALVMLAQGVLFGLFFTGRSTTEEGEGGWIKGTLMMVLGILLLISAYRTFTNEPDPDAPPPKWMTLIERATPLVALALGAGMVLISAKMWVFTMGAISGIGDARLGQPASSITYLLFVLLVLSTLLVPILLSVIFPVKSVALLAALRNWLETHNREIMLVISLVFGALFLYQGITALLT